MKQYLKALVNPKLVPTALKVALIVGTALLAINHGMAIVKGDMTHQRWISGFFSYLVPYCVNIHGQYVNRSRRRGDRC